MMPLESTVARLRRPPRGQPVIALVMILAIWIAIRATFVAIENSPAAKMQRLDGNAGALRLAAPVLGPRKPAGSHRSHAGLATLAVPQMLRRREHTAALRVPLTASGGAEGPLSGLVQRPAADFGLTAAEAFGADPVPASAGIPFLAGNRLSYLAKPAGSADPESAAKGEAKPDRSSRERASRGGSSASHLRRWSADGWLLLRGGDQAPALSPGAAAYGGSQAGGVLRYDLAPARALPPQAYLRVATALGAQARQSEAALGLMVRPARRLPVALLGELRLQQQGGITRSRPVVIAVTQLPPQRLPLDAEAEAYAQGGWAGGRDATPFFDLAATLQRPVIHPLRGTRISAGGGVWSGGQRGAERLDLGLRIEMRTMLGPSPRPIGVRVGVDWRFRVAGRAEPGSGPALTVAAGF